MSLAVANRYARALAGVVWEPGSGVDARRASEQIREVEELVSGSADLRNVLLNPVVAPADKRAVVTRLGESLGLHPLVRNFLCVVIGRRRIGILGEIRRAFEAVIDEHFGIVQADVTASSQLTGEQREAVETALESVTGKQIRCEYATDDTLLGGAVVQIGSTVYDGSIQGQLEDLRQRLAE